MSAAPSHPRDLGYSGLRMSASEFLLLGETDARLELIDGVVVVSPSPLPRHQKLVQEIFRQLDRAAGEPPAFDVFLDTDVRFGESVVYQPDVSVFKAGRLPEMPELISVSPDLVFEVLSPGNKAVDLVTKRGDYERFGVLEYVVIDSISGEFRCWSRNSATEKFVDATITNVRWQSRVIASIALDLTRLRSLAQKS